MREMKTEKEKMLAGELYDPLSLILCLVRPTAMRAPVHLIIAVALAYASLPAEARDIPQFLSEQLTSGVRVLHP